MKDAQPIQVLLASDNALLSECLAERLVREPGFCVAGQVAGAAQLLDAVKRRGPDLVLFDADGMGALPHDLLVKVRNRWPQLRILVLAPRADDHFAARLLLAGASGVHGSGEDFGQLVRALTTVAQGQSWARRKAVARALEGLPRSATPRGPGLTPREREILGLLREGYRNKELATLLQIKEQTVKVHLHSLFRKLNVRTRLEAALKAAEIA